MTPEDGLCAALRSWRASIGLPKPSVLVVGDAHLPPLQDCQVEYWRPGTYDFEHIWREPPAGRFDLVLLGADFARRPRPCLSFLPRLSGHLIVLGDPAGAFVRDAAVLLSAIGFAICRQNGVTLARWPEFRSHRLRPLLVHVHVPKTAGTSFVRVLERSFGDRHLNHYHPEPGYYCEPEELFQLLVKHPYLVSLSSHAFRVMPPVIGDRLMLYTCFLRDPVAMFLSNVTFIKKEHATFSPEHQATLPPDVDSLSVPDLAAWLLDQTGNVIHRIIQPTRFLAEDHWRYYTGRAFSPEQRDGAVQEALARCYESIAPRVALQQLERFVSIGLTERIPESLVLMRDALSCYGLDLDITAEFHEKPSAEVLSDRSWVCREHPVGARILDFAERDRPLYEYARRRFECEWAEASR